MEMFCRHCEQTYEDVTHWTYCPHDRFITDEVAARKDLGHSLLGKQVSIGSLTTRTRRVAAVTWEGYVVLEGLPGRVAPEVLHVVE